MMFYWCRSYDKQPVNWPTAIIALYIKYKSWKVVFAKVWSAMLTADGLMTFLFFTNTLWREKKRKFELLTWKGRKQSETAEKKTTYKNIATLFFCKMLSVVSCSQLASDIVLALSVMRPINYEEAAMQMDLINCLLSRPWLLYLEGEVFISVILKQVRKLFCQSARNDSDRVGPSYRKKSKNEKKLSLDAGKLSPLVVLATPW